MAAAFVAGAFSVLAAGVGREPQGPDPGSTGVSVSVDYAPDPATWVSTLSPGQIGSPPPYSEHCGSAARLAWIRSRPAVQATQNYVKVTVTAKRSSNVVIRDVKVDQRRLEPPRPAHNYGLCRGADGLSARLIEIDLDAAPVRPVFRDYREDAADPGGTAVPVFAFSVNPGQLELLLLETVARAGTYAWTARLLMTVDGKDVEETITDNGEAFAVTPLAPGDSYVSEDPDGGPFEADPT